MSTANVMLMNSSFLVIVASAPRTLPATSADPLLDPERQLHDRGFECQLILVDLEE